MVKQAVADLGRLDVLINNAGTSNTVDPVPFEDLVCDDRGVLERHPRHQPRWAIPMRARRGGASGEDRGAIVNTASVAGLGTRGSSIAYGASKAGLINLTRTLGIALGPEVRVNAVAPGLVDTPWTQPWPEERKRQYIDATMLKRIVKPEDIANAMLFLAVHPRDQRADAGHRLRAHLTPAVIETGSLQPPGQVSRRSRTHSARGHRERDALSRCALAISGQTLAVGREHFQRRQSSRPADSIHPDG